MLAIGPVVSVSVGSMNHHSLHPPQSALLCCISFAGRVDVCCFDKTGTLTEDTMQIEGFAAVVGQEALLQRDIRHVAKRSDSRGILQLQREMPMSASTSTGTSTSTGQESAPFSFSQLPCEASGFMATVVVAGCHSLINTAGNRGGGGGSGSKGTVVGDPMEQEAFRAAGFTLTVCVVLYCMC